MCEMFISLQRKIMISVMNDYCHFIVQTGRFIRIGFIDFNLDTLRQKFPDEFIPPDRYNPTRCI